MPADVTLTRPTHADGSSINAAVFNSETVLAASVPDATAATEGVEAGRFLRLWPHRHATDGFFAAVWQRQD